MTGLAIGYEYCDSLNEAYPEGKPRVAEIWFCSSFSVMVSSTGGHEDWQLPAMLGKSQ